MAVLLIQHTVKNYSDWKKGFDGASQLRKSFGEVSTKVYRDASDGNKITVVNQWDSLANAHKFAASAELKAAMEKAGVVGAPSVSFLDEA
jgi:heme-degrading monooxygenase HmoA